MSTPEPRRETITLASEAETLAWAEELAGLLRPGDVVCLHGDLGAGKTTFTRGLVRGLGSPAPVSSPTFTLVHEYGGGRLPIVHIDAYRLGGAPEAEDAGIAEYLDRDDGVTVIEWPERLAELLPASRLELTLRDAGDNKRNIEVAGSGVRWEGTPLC